LVLWYRGTSGQGFKLDIWFSWVGFQFHYGLYDYVITMLTSLKVHINLPL
jgi:hypothetical protein